jgi:hypothetical protein
MSTILSKNMSVAEYDDIFDRMTKARVVDNMDDMRDIDTEDDVFNRMTKARVVDNMNDIIVIIHPTAKIIKDFSNVVQTSPIIEVSKIFNHNKIKKPKDFRKLARIIPRSISAEFIKKFLIPNYSGRPQTLVELLDYYKNKM